MGVTYEENEYIVDLSSVRSTELFPSLIDN